MHRYRARAIDRSAQLALPIDIRPDWQLVLQCSIETFAYAHELLRFNYHAYGTPSKCTTET